ncbi:VOC family protein [Candidatus Curtissbacteria bacterium]|nr:VOC family protein [Candidatus Curtissbacteria bacterium]
MNLFTENAKRLAAFYRDKLGLAVTFEGEMGEGDEIYELALGKGPNLYIIDHSKVKGKNKNPEMIIFNVEVDDIKKEVARLKRAKVRQIQPTYHVEGYGWISTFADVDGNYFQLVQVKATSKK